MTDLSVLPPCNCFCLSSSYMASRYAPNGQPKPKLYRPSCKMRQQANLLGCKIVISHDTAFQYISMHFKHVARLKVHPQAWWLFWPCNFQLHGLQPWWNSHKNHGLTVRSALLCWRATVGSSRVKHPGRTCWKIPSCRSPSWFGTLWPRSGVWHDNGIAVWVSGQTFEAYKGPWNQWNMCETFTISTASCWPITYRHL